MNIQVDEEDIPKLNKYNWWVSRPRPSNKGWAKRYYFITDIPIVECRSIGVLRKKLSLHRYIMNCPKNMTVGKAKNVFLWLIYRINFLSGQQLKLSLIY